MAGERSGASAPPLKAPELPERTLEQKQQDAIAKTLRHLNLAGYQLEGVQHTQDLRAWEVNHTEILVAIATSTEALEKAKQLRADADTLTALQTRLTTLSQAATDAKPPARAELTRESDICAALTAKPQGSVSERMHEKARADLAALRRDRLPRLTSTRSDRTIGIAVDAYLDRLHAQGDLASGVCIPSGFDVASETLRC